MSMDIRTITEYDHYYFYPLYPHGFDDLVFLIFERSKLRDDVRRSPITPILQWFIIITIASIIIYGLRKIAQRRVRRILRMVGDEDVPEYYVYSFVDSVGVFLGTAINKFGTIRAECWFLVAFSVFGMIFKMIYTDQLFAMFLQPNPTRITSIEQLIDANIQIFTDGGISRPYYTTQLRIKA